MINAWHDVDIDRVSSDDFVAIVEIPKKSKTKYEMDKATGMLKMDRVLYTSMNYPANYGFIPLTYAEDKDPLDVLVLCSEELYPLTMVRCYPIGMMEMIDDGEHDEKIIAVPFKDPNFNDMKDIEDVPHHMLDEIQHFFSRYKELEYKKTSVEGFKNAEDAKAMINKCIKNYKNKFGNCQN